MKSFFSSFFGSLAALVVVFAGLAFAMAIVASGLSVRRDTPPSLESGSWLVLELSDEFQDAPVGGEGLEQLTRLVEQDETNVMQVRQVTRALEAAANDAEVAGLYLSGQNLSPGRSTGYAALHEIREAIGRFRAAGKPVKAWLNFGGTREFYLASAADELVLDPFGALLLPGLASQPMFFAGAFEKLGIGVQVTRVGKFKSAVEPYIRKDMSPESRAQTQKLLDDLWGELRATIDAARKLDAGGLQSVADSEGLLRAEQALDRRLVDRVAYLDEVLDELRTATGVKDSRRSFKQISIADYARLVPASNLAARRRATGDTTEPDKNRAHEKIAIAYAEGAIVDGAGSDRGVVWGDKLARELREIRRDDTVKAVVLRVNSPGGSVTASEAIQRELRLIQKSKPVVVSMGSYAASGGYWISTYSDRIFAEPTTITGSIGVFGLLFNVEALATDKLGLTFETVKTGRFADAATILRPKTPEELEILQRSVDWVYDQFLAKVSESRKLSRETVGEIAEGRVWSGKEAVKLGLVDELGSLDQAVAFAATKAAVGEEFSVVEYPVRRPLLEAVSEAFGRRRKEKAAFGTVAAWMHQALEQLAVLGEFNDPRGIYARLPFDLALN